MTQTRQQVEIRIIQPPGRGSAEIAQLRQLRPQHFIPFLALLPHLLYFLKLLLSLTTVLSTRGFRVRLLDEHASGPVRVAERVDPCDVVWVVVLEHGFQEAGFVVVADAAAMGVVAAVVVPPAAGAVVGAADVGLGVTEAERVGGGAVIGRFDG